MGGVVNDGRPLCWVHIGHHPFFKVLSYDFYLGDGEGGKGTGRAAGENQILIPIDKLFHALGNN
jgi:hypothetical protein